MANLSLTIPQDQLDKLRDEAIKESKTITAVVQEIISLYYKQKENPESLHSTKADIAELKKLLVSIRPVTYEIPNLTPPIQELKPLVNLGLTIPEVNNNIPDPEIEAAFQIKPGEGVANRLKSIGVDPVAVIRAKRAKAFGRPYDKTLEQYFNLV